MTLIVAILAGLALLALAYRLYRHLRLTPRDRWLRRYDERLKKNHPFFI